MSSEVATQTRTSDPSHGAGRRGNKPRNRGAASATRGGSNRTGGNTNKVNEVISDAPVVKAGDVAHVASTLPVAPSENGDIDVCWICAEQVKYYAVSECNHRTCQVCALRLRALYKKMECTFCKVSCLLTRDVVLIESGIRKRRTSSYSRNLRMPFFLRTPRNRSHIKTRGCLYLSRQPK